MKKLILVVLILTVLAGAAFAQQWWGVTNQENGRAMPNNTVNLRRGNNYVYFYFNDEQPRPAYQKVRIDFTIDNPVNIYWMCMYAPNQVWGTHRGGTNRASWHITEQESGYIETDVSVFQHTWHDGTRKPFAPEEGTGVCIEINTPARSQLVITNISFH